MGYPERYTFVIIWNYSNWTTRHTINITYVVLDVLFLAFSAWRTLDRGAWFPRASHSAAQFLDVDLKVQISCLASCCCSGSEMLGTSPDIPFASPGDEKASGGHEARI